MLLLSSPHFHGKKAIAAFGAAGCRFDRMLQRNDRRIRATDKQTGGALQSIDLIALLTKKQLGTINMKEKRLRSDSPRKRKVDAIEKIQSRQ